MIDLYSTGFGASPNVYKVILTLEELGLEYRIKPVAIQKGEQFAPEFLAVSPNNKVPAIVDHAPADGGPPLSLFESGAILTYLADKAGALLPPPQQARARAVTLQWVYWQMGGFGPNIGQFIHFAVYAPEKIAYALTRFSNEINRLLGVIDRRLAQSPWVGGEDYSIADIISFASTHEYKRLGQDIDAFPHFVAWQDRIRARPAYARAYLSDTAASQETIGADHYMQGEAWNTLFAQTAQSVQAAAEGRPQGV